MKTPEEIAAEIVKELMFTSNRILNGKMISEAHFASDAIARAIKLDRLRMAGSITMNEVRLHVGEGRLSYQDILTGVEAILRSRSGH